MSSSCAMRAATLRAAMRRGCVWPIIPATPRPSSRQIFGSCVVLPEPVSPQRTTTWFSAMAARDLVALLDDRQARRVARLGQIALRAFATSGGSLDVRARHSGRPSQATPRADSWSAVMQSREARLEIGHVGRHGWDCRYPAELRYMAVVVVGRVAGFSRARSRR